MLLNVFIFFPDILIPNFSKATTLNLAEIYVEITMDDGRTCKTALKPMSEPLQFPDAFEL
jgi:hypothetical protein